VIGESLPRPVERPRRLQNAFDLLLARRLPVAFRRSHQAEAVADVVGASPRKLAASSSFMIVIVSSSCSSSCVMRCP
jgi:hypothetical protein